MHFLVVGRTMPSSFSQLYLPFPTRERQRVYKKLTKKEIWTRLNSCHQRLQQTQKRVGQLQSAIMNRGTVPFYEKAQKLAMVPNNALSLSLSLSAKKEGDFNASRRPYAESGWHGCLTREFGAKLAIDAGLPDTYTKVSETETGRAAQQSSAASSLQRSETESNPGMQLPGVSHTLGGPVN